MSGSIQISIVIPVYNRPIEVEELLESLTHQTNKQFEIIIVEDGSVDKCDKVVEAYSSQLNVKYFFKENSGPGTSRNYGCEKAAGNYYVFLDSDCIIPPQYVETVYDALENNYIDAFGGPDEAHEDFTDFQKAINYSMTSFFTTGGIRGGSEKLDNFFPRSFNMGYSKAVYQKTKGFSKIRFGEDIDLSIRILRAGFKTGLVKKAYVYHKRRTSVRQFFKQIYNSGIARINLYKRYPDSLKVVHMAPAVFTLSVIGILVLSVVWSPCFLVLLALHFLVLFVDSTIKNKSIKIGVLSIVTSYIQLNAYGIGFLIAFWKRIVLRKDEFSAFNKTFYK